MTFDPDSPPETYAKFHKEVLKTVDEAEIDVEDPYDVALFLVSRENEGQLIYIEDILEELDEDVEIDEIVTYYLPEIVKKNNSKFFAFVFPGFQRHENEEIDDGPELVCVLSSTLFDMKLNTSEITRDEDDIYAETGPWTEEDPADYPNLTVPFRKAITYQSE